MEDYDNLVERLRDAAKSEFEYENRPTWSSLLFDEAADAIEALRGDDDAEQAQEAGIDFAEERRIAEVLRRWVADDASWSVLRDAELLVALLAEHSAREAAIERLRDAAKTTPLVTLPWFLKELDALIPPRRKHGADCAIRHAPAAECTCGKADRERRQPLDTA